MTRIPQAGHAPVLPEHMSRKTKTKVMKVTQLHLVTKLRQTGRRVRYPAHKDVKPAARDDQPAKRQKQDPPRRQSVDTNSDVRISTEGQ